jgi:hypothetical protein
VSDSGGQYERTIYARRGKMSIVIDVYCAIEAFAVRCPAVQHALKKLLCAGIRGKGDTLQDLHEARDAIDRAITLEEQRAQASH